MVEENPPPQVGDVLVGKYRLERVLGEGGMGTVFAAHHLVLDQTVAVKILAPDLAESSEIAERFLQEARAAAKLQSEHVARVMDAGIAESGLPFFVMERLEGHDLGGLVLTGTVQCSPEEVADWALQTLEGLAHAHRAGIVHRDIKPGNLFLATRAGAPSVVKVLDFGISKATMGQTGKEFRTLTGGHQIIGSPGYMSPEQVSDSSKVDPRTDIWSLGVVMYELLTGRPAFAGEGPIKIFAAILDEPPTEVRALNEDVPEALEAVIARCLEKERDKRFVDVAEFARALAPLVPPESLPLVERIERLMTDAPRRRQDTPSPRRSMADRGSLASTVAVGSPDEDRRAAGLPKRRSLVVPLLIVLMLLGVGFYLLQGGRVRVPDLLGSSAVPGSGSVPPRASSWAHPSHSAIVGPVHSGIPSKPPPHPSTKPHVGK